MINMNIKWVTNSALKGVDKPLRKVHLLRHDGLAGRGLDGPDS